MTKNDPVFAASERLQRRRAAAQSNGSEGGFKRAEHYDHEILSEWAAKGGKAVLEKYGPEYFVELRKRRMTCSNDIERREAFENAQAKARTMARKRNAQKGGLNRGKLYSPAQRSNWARKGGIATQARYGNDFYRGIRKLRKKYRKGYLARKTKERLRESFTRTVSALAEDDHLAWLGRFLAERQ